MTTSDITIDTADGAMSACVATPDGQPRGAVIVIQEAFGLTDHIRDVAARLASAGYLGIAPALYHRQGSPVVAYDDMETVMPLMGQLTGAGLTTDVAATISYLQDQGFAAEKIAIVGFCMGGSVVLMTAAQHKIGAAVTYYGGGLTSSRFDYPPLNEVAGSLLTPWIGHFGDLDQGIPADDVEQLRTIAAGAPVDTAVYRYADAGHGFNCNDRPWMYNAPAAAQAWERTLEFLNSHVG